MICESNEILCLLLPKVFAKQTSSLAPREIRGRLAGTRRSSRERFDSPAGYNSSATPDARYLCFTGVINPVTK